MLNRRKLFWLYPKDVANTNKQRRVFCMNIRFYIETNILNIFDSKTALFTI